MIQPDGLLRGHLCVLDFDPQPGLSFFTRWEVLIPSFLGRNVAEREKANLYP
jgi:hypothetical protein